MIGFSLLWLLAVQASQPAPVVTISAAELARAPRLTIARKPVWRVGGDGEGPFSFTRVISGTFTNAGVAVLEHKPSEVRLFSAAGQHVLSFGRQGRGPGEFEEAGRLQIHGGDSLVVLQNSAVSVFDAGGNYARRVSAVNTAAGYTLMVRMLPNATLLAHRHAVPSRQHVEGIRREKARVVILSPRGDSITRDLGERLFGETVIARTGEAVVFTSRAFGAEHLLEGGDSVFFSIQTDSPSVEVVGARTGRQLRALKFDVPRRAVAARHREEFARERRAQAREPRWRQNTEAYLKIMPYPNQMPYFDALRWSYDRVVRLRRYVAPLDSTAQWLSLTATGQLLSLIDLPAKARVLDFDRDRVLLVERDADDLEYLALYKLVPSKR